MAPSDLLRFTVADGYLIVLTKLPPTNPQLQQVHGMISPAYIHILHREPVSAGAEYTPDMVNINVTQREGQRIMRTSLGSMADQMNFSRDVVIGSVEQSIQFIQFPSAAASGSAARLIVQSMDGENIDKQDFVAEHFSAFIRKYPKQTTDYLRPMLETFGLQPQLFAVNDELACAVLPEAFQPDAKTRDELLRLVDDLKADDFHKRQQADAAIAAMGIRALPVLGALDGAALAPEQATRIDALLVRLKPPFDISPRQLREDRSFLLDCLLSDNKAVRTAAATRLSKLAGKPLALPESASPSVETVYQLRRELLAPATAPAQIPTTKPSRK